MKINKIIIAVGILSSLSFASIDCKSFFNNSNYEKSFSCFNKELKKNKSFDNYFYIASSLLQQQKYKDALPYFLNAEKLSPDNSFLSSIYNKISFIYSSLGDQNLELEYSMKSLDLELKIGNKFDIAVAYNNLGAYYFNNNDINSALENFNKALEYNELNSDTYTNLAISYEQLQDFAKAEKFYKEAINFDNLLNDAESLCHHNFNLAEFFYNRDLFSSSYPVFIETIDNCQIVKNTSIEVLSLIYLSYLEIEKERLSAAKSYYDEAKKISNKNLPKDIFVELDNLNKVLKKHK